MSFASVGNEKWIFAVYRLCFSSLVKKIHFILVYDKRKHFYFLFRNEIDWEWVGISFDLLIGDRDSNMAFDMLF